MHNYFYQEPGCAVPPPSRPGNRKRHVLAFLVVLTILGIVTAVTIRMLQNTEYSAGASDGGYSDPWNNYNYEEESLLPAQLAKAPLASGFTLTLSGSAASLTPQEIYRKTLPSIVYILVSEGDVSGEATGVILSADGYLLTNAHVVSGCTDAWVYLQDDREYEARLVGEDLSTDLAVLKIEAEDLTPAEFGDSDTLSVGDTVYAIGNPLGVEYRNSMTDGIVSALSRDILMDQRSMLLIQHTAAINPGSSGGVLVNEAGQVIGVTNMKIMTTDYDPVEGLGFAIPSSTCKPVVEMLMEQGYVSDRPVLGITVYAQAAEDDVPAGIRVESVDEKSSAWAEGLRPGDVILTADGTEVLETEDLVTVKGEKQVGDTISLEIWREGETFTITVKLVDQYTLD